MPYLYLVQSNMESTKVMDYGTHDQRAHGRTVSAIFESWESARQALVSIRGFIEEQAKRDCEVRFGDPHIHTLAYGDEAEREIKLGIGTSTQRIVQRTRSNVVGLVEDVIYRTSELFWLDENGKPMNFDWEEDDDGFNWTRRGVTE